MHRKYKIEVYPNGTVLVHISASDQPFGWLDRKDWQDFISSCGRIHQVISHKLSISEPLKTKIYNWFITQMHIGYDIPLSKLNQHHQQYKAGNNDNYKIYEQNNLSQRISKKTLEFARMFNGSIKVNELDRVYQIYDKALPTKERCFRAEEQLSFSSPSPTNSSSSFAESPSSSSISPSSSSYKIEQSSNNDENNKNILTVFDLKSYSPTPIKDIINKFI
jgi:hypothetical protein